jgi:hypothetical protein
MREMTFMAACKEFFGQKEGQTNLDFGKEVKALTQQDREDLKPGLEAALGCKIINA